MHYSNAALICVALTTAACHRDLHAELCEQEPTHKWCVDPADSESASDSGFAVFGGVMQAQAHGLAQAQALAQARVRARAEAAILRC